ncbi:MAG: tryptophan-rich sensory protein [Cyclobacteriaceae bacterium]
MKKTLPFIVIPAFFIMIYINYLSGAGKINDISAGGVSDKYYTLFTPAGFTFSIWGLIYLFNLFFSIRLFWEGVKGRWSRELNSISIYFILTCILNISWIYAWHYDILALSVLLMLGLLITLIILYQKVSDKDYTSVWSYLTTFTPISLYLGWICIATVANFSVWLTALMWDGAPFSAAFWASLMLIVAAIINLFILAKKRDIVFALVYLWAAYGIFAARSGEAAVESLWVSRSVIAGMIIAISGVLYTGYIQFRKIRISS